MLPKVWHSMAFIWHIRILYHRVDSNVLKQPEVQHNQQRYTYLGALAKLRKATISFITSVRPSARNNSAPTGRIFMKFDFSVFIPKTVKKIKVSLNFNTNKGYFTWIFIYIYNDTSLNSSQNEKCFRKKVQFMFNKFFFLNRAVYEIMWKNNAERGRSQMT